MLKVIAIGLLSLYAAAVVVFGGLVLYVAIREKKRETPHPDRRTRG